LAVRALLPDCWAAELTQIAELEHFESVYMVGLGFFGKEARVAAQVPLYLAD
jgi:hypothetical protein